MIDIILLVLIGVSALALSVLPVIYNVNAPAKTGDKRARAAFIISAIAILILTLVQGVRTVENEFKAPYELSAQQLSFTLEFDCVYCSDTDVDTFKIMPTEFTVENISIGSSNYTCDFSRIEKPISISGPRASRKKILYRSTYLSLEDKRSDEKYLWDLDSTKVSVSLPREFNEFFIPDSTKESHIPFWSSWLSVEVDKVSIGKGKFAYRNKWSIERNFSFYLENLSKEEVKKNLKFGNKHF